MIDKNRMHDVILVETVNLYVIAWNFSLGDYEILNKIG